MPDNEITIEAIYGPTGATGNGIDNITKTDTTGNVDTYTITYTNGDTDEFTVTNGQDGADGTDGIDGVAATITVGSVTTGNAGSNATVTNSGTSSAAIFDFTIPKGDKGDKGEAGTTNYNDLTNKPTKLSDFTDDLGTSPTHTHSQYLTEHQDISGKADKATTLAGYGITDAYTKTEVDGKLTSAMHYKGTVATVSALDNITSPAVGDVYNITATGDNYAYDSSGWDKLSGVVDLSAYAKTSDLATVATSGSYNDLTNKPTIPAAQVNSDWNSSSGVSQILNKPTIPAAQIQSDWEQTSTSAKDYIKNKPTIPTVPTNVSAFTNDAGYTTNTGTITGITMNGASKGTSGVVDLGTVITSHQDISGKQDASTAVTHTASTAVGSATKGVYIASDGTATAMTYSLNKDVPSNAVFTDTTYSVFTGADGTNAGTSGLVKAPTATDNTKFLKGDGTWATPAGSSYTFSTGLTESGGTVSVTDYNELIKNTAIEADSLSILGTQSYGNAGTINIGYNSEGSAVNGVAIGTSSKTMTNATAIGYGAKVLGTVQNPAFSGIQLGYGTNNDENTMYVGFLNANQANYKLLDGTTGKIPNARLDMDTTPTSASTKPITSGGVYTVLGDIETLLAAV